MCGRHLPALARSLLLRSGLPTPSYGITVQLERMFVFNGRSSVTPPRCKWLTPSTAVEWSSSLELSLCRIIRVCGCGHHTAISCLVVPCRVYSLLKACTLITSNLFHLHRCTKCVLIKIRCPASPWDGSWMVTVPTSFY